MNRECKSKAKTMAMAKASPHLSQSAPDSVSRLLCPQKASMKTLATGKGFTIS
jgi:hypothetical protein